MKKYEKPRFFGRQSRLTWNEIMMCLATFGIGLVLLIWPQIAEEAVMTAIGAIAIVIGLSFVVRYAMMELIDAIDSNALPSGLMWIAGGILVIALRKLLVILLPILLGLFILFCGMTKLHLTLNLKRMNAVKWYLELANAVFSIIIGIITICRPFAANEVLMRFAGAGLVIEGIIDFISRFIYAGIHDNFMRIYANTTYKQTVINQEATDQQNEEDDNKAE